MLIFPIIEIIKKYVLLYYKLGGKILLSRPFNYDRYCDQIDGRIPHSKNVFKCTSEDWNAIKSQNKPAKEIKLDQFDYVHCCVKGFILVLIAIGFMVYQIISKYGE